MPRKSCARRDEAARLDSCVREDSPPDPRHSMSQKGHSRRFWDVRAESAFPPIATGQRTCQEVRVAPTADSCSAAKEPWSLDRFIVGSTERGRLGLVRQCRNRYDFDYEFGMCKCRSINGSGSFTVNRDDALRPARPASFSRQHRLETPPRFPGTDEQPR
jgi:hypothetical protein